MSEELKETECKCNGSSSNHNSCLTAILVAIIVVLVGCIIYLDRHKIADFFTGENQTEVQTEENEPVIVEDVPLTIKDFLEMREVMREDRRIDSIFLSIPEVVLVDILTQHGTSLSNADVVHIYEANPRDYNKVVSGAKAQQYVEDSIKRDANNDSLPNK